jgi:hypothetical protein
MNSDWRRLDRFFRGLDTKHSAFISINWDTVIELNWPPCQKLIALITAAEHASHISQKGKRSG